MCCDMYFSKYYLRYQETKRIAAVGRITGRQIVGRITGRQIVGRITGRQIVGRITGRQIVC